MLLPHGYDGWGPDHSSCRMERFLQLCNQDEVVPFDGQDYDNASVRKIMNMHVVYPSTAANYFHLLRQQMRMPFRKPLVVVQSKKLLKVQKAASNIEDFGENTQFLPLIADQNPNLVAKDRVRKVILCSG